MPMVAESMTVTFSSFTPGRSTVTAPMWKMEGEKRRTPMPRTTLLAACTLSALTRVLASTVLPFGFVPM